MAVEEMPAPFRPGCKAISGLISSLKASRTLPFKLVVLGDSKFTYTQIHVMSQIYYYEKYYNTNDDHSNSNTNNNRNNYVRNINIRRNKKLIIIFIIMINQL